MDELFVQINDEVSEDTLLCYIATSDECYALKYSSENASVRNNVYLVLVNYSKSAIKEEYAEKGEHINLDANDVIRIYGGGNQVFCSINNDDNSMYKFIIPDNGNNNQLIYDKEGPFSYSGEIIENTKISHEINNNLSIISQQEYYTHQTLDPSESRLNVSESITTSSSSEATQTSITNSSIETTEEKNTANNFIAIMGSIVVVIIIISLAFRKREDLMRLFYKKVEKRNSERGPSGGTNDRNYRFTVYRSTGTNSLISPSIAFSNALNKNDNNDVFTNAKMLRKITISQQGYDLRYDGNTGEVVMLPLGRIDHLSDLGVQLARLNTFPVSFSNKQTGYRLVVLSFDNSQKRFYYQLLKDYASQVPITELLQLLTYVTNSPSKENESEIDILFSLIDEVDRKFPMINIYAIESFRTLCNKNYDVLCDWKQYAKLEKGRIENAFKNAIAALITILAAKTYPEIQETVWVKDCVKSICELEDSFRVIIPNIVTVTTNSPVSQVNNQRTVATNNPTPNIILTEANPIPTQNTEHVPKSEINSVSSSSNFIPDSSSAVDYSNLYINTRSFLSGKEIVYYTLDRNTSLYNVDDVKLSSVSPIFKNTADYIALGALVFLNPNKYKNGQITIQHVSEALIDRVFSIDGLTGRGVISTIEPAQIDVNSLKLITKGLIRI